MLKVGDVVQGRYLVERVIGEGGMGRLFQARRLSDEGGALTLKEVDFSECLHGAGADVRDQYREDVDRLMWLSHPNLVRVLDCFEDGGRVYVLSEYVEGYSLERIAFGIKEPLDLGLVLSWIEQLGSALAYLHQHNPVVVCRSLCPENVLLDSEGVPHIQDLGLARVVRGGTLDLAEGHGMVGYAPIEQLDPLGYAADPRADVYGLGAILYCLLTQQHPPEARERLIDEALDLQTLAPHVPVPLLTVVEQMLRLRPDDRLHSVETVREAIHKALSKPASRRAASPSSRRSGASSRRNPASRRAPSSRKRRVSLDESGPVRKSSLSVDAPPAPAPPPPPPPAPEPESAAEPEVIANHPDPTGAMALVLDMKTAAARQVQIYIKDMLGRRTDLTVTGIDGAIVTFFCSPKVALTSPLKVFVPLDGGEKNAGLAILNVLKQRIQDDSRWVDAQVTQASQGVMEHLRQSLPNAQEGPSQRRRAKRIPVSFQVTSADLPEYRGLALDVTMHGVRLHIGGEVKVGTVATLVLDFDDFSTTPATVKAEVRWCNPDPKRGFQAGFEFRHMDSASRQALELYLSLKTKRK